MIRFFSQASFVSITEAAYFNFFIHYFIYIYIYIQFFLRKMLGTRYGSVGSRFLWF